MSAARRPGQAVAVVGGAGGIGTAVVQRLLRDRHRVAVVDASDAAMDRLRTELPEQLRQRARFFKCDISDPASVDLVRGDVLEATGGLIGLVMCAAMMAGIPRRPFEDIPVAEWDAMMATNLRGTFLCCRAFSQTLKARSGSIVLVSSDMFLSGAPGMLHYVASKGGLVAMTRALASEFGDWNVRVNCVAPGFTETHAVHDVAAVIRAERVAGRAIKRAEIPSDIAGVVSFLLSADAAFITGQTIPVNGGYRFV